MKAHKFTDIDIRHAVAVRHHERLIPHILANAADAPTRQGIESRIDDRNLPRLRMLVVHNHAVFLREVERDVGRMQKVVSEPFLDHMLFVARAYNEIVEAKMAVSFHDVPEDRHAADLHHGLGASFRLLGDSRTESACQKHCFQIFISFYYQHCQCSSLPPLAHNRAIRYSLKISLRSSTSCA